MKTFAAEEVGDNFGRLLEAAETEPVTIARNGASVAVVMPIQGDNRLEIEDRRAPKAHHEARVAEWLRLQDGGHLLNRIFHGEP